VPEIGKFGLRERPADHGPSLKLAQILSGVVPAHPLIADYGASIHDWDMRGNDQFGDCVAVTWANNRYLITKFLAEHGYYPSVAQVFELYKTQNPNFRPDPDNPVEDNGMVIQYCLDYLRKTGGPDGVKAVAFAEVDTNNLEEIRAAAAIFGGLWYGVSVSAANQDQFNLGRPWDYVRGSRNLGGHAILGPGYDPDIRFVTWAEETEFTENFIRNQMGEAWVVIWPEHFGTKAFQQGVDLAALKAAYKDLTGKDLPTPTPTPGPGAATFLGATPEVDQRIRSAATRAKLTPAAWLNKHFTTYFSL
jgi:hypothetical protein